VCAHGASGRGGCCVLGLNACVDGAAASRLAIRTSVVRRSASNTLYGSVGQWVRSTTGTSGNESAQCVKSFPRFPSEYRRHHRMQKPTQPRWTCCEVVFVFDGRCAVSQVPVPNRRGEGVEKRGSIEHLYGSDLRRIEIDVFRFQCNAAQMPSPGTNGRGMKLSLSPVIAEVCGPQ